MIKNTSGQSVGCQMISATDGSAFTGAVTVYVTGDNGTQAVGSVSSGACTHEGNGYHSYGPAQAETNYDHVAFTFTGTGAVPATVQVFTRVATPAVNVTQFGGSSGTFASGRPEIVIQDSGITAAKIATDAITADKIAANAIGASELASDAVTEIQSGLATAAALATVDGIVDDILADTAVLGTPVDLDDAGATIADNAVTLYNRINLVKNVTDTLEDVPADIAALPTATENADAVLTRDWTEVAGEASRSVLNALRVLRNAWAITAGAWTITKEDDETPAFSKPVTGTPGADPVTQVGADD